MTQYKKTPSQLVKQFMQSKEYAIPVDLAEFLSDIDIYFEREIKNAYNAGDGNEGRGEATKYYFMSFTETK
jgi:hypothetical protein